MTSLVTKLVLKKFFKENKDNKEGYEDPYFETVPATRMGIKTKKKLPKAHPPGITEKEAAALTKAKRRAYRMDLSLGTFLGIRVGWSAVIGLIPGIGDVLDMLLCLMVYRTICSVEPKLDSGIKMKMKFNIIVDFILGIVPFIGDVADAAYKCNTKNVILFEEELRKRGKKRLKGTPQETITDPSLPDEFDDITEADARQRNGPPPRYQSQRERDRRERRGRRDDSTVDIESEAAYTESTIEPPRRVRSTSRRDRRDQY